MKYLDPKADLILKRRFAVKSIIFLTFVISHFRLLRQKANFVVFYHKKPITFMNIGFLYRIYLNC